VYAFALKPYTKNQIDYITNMMEADNRSKGMLKKFYLIYTFYLIDINSPLNKGTPN